MSRRPMRVRLRAGALWELLDRRNLSQNDLAHRLGVSSGHLSRLVNGRRCPSPSLRRLLMESLNCAEFDDLFELVDDDA